MTPGSAGGREVPLEVHEDGARDVASRVHVAPAPQVAQVPAHIGDAQSRVADAGGELRGADERPTQSLAHGVAVTFPGWLVAAAPRSGSVASVAQAALSGAPFRRPLVPRGCGPAPMAWGGSPATLGPRCLMTSPQSPSRSGCPWGPRLVRPCWASSSAPPGAARGGPWRPSTCLLVVSIGLDGDLIIDFPEPLTGSGTQLPAAGGSTLPGLPLERGDAAEEDVRQRPARAARRQLKVTVARSIGVLLGLHGVGTVDSSVVARCQRASKPSMGRPAMTGSDRGPLRRGTGTLPVSTRCGQIDVRRFARHACHVVADRDQSGAKSAGCCRGMTRFVSLCHPMTRTDRTAR